MSKRIRIHWMISAGDSFNIDPPEDWDKLTIAEKRAEIEQFVEDAVYECFSTADRQFSYEEFEDERNTEED